MNCRKLEEKIYLYKELTSSEKKIVDEHLNQCDNCRRLAGQLYSSQGLIHMAARHKPEMINPKPLTNRIMSAIEKEKDQSFFSQLISYLDNSFFRFAISAASVILISFFVYEQQPTNLRSSVSKEKTEISKGSILDYGKFRIKYAKQKETRSTAHNSRYTYYKFEIGKK